MGDESGYQATETDITVDTLTGDIRDFLLGHMRDLQKPWQQMSEREQSDKIYAAESAARSMVRKAVNLITAREFTVKDGEIKAEFTTPATDANLISVRHAGLAVLVLADPTVFEGARSEAKADPDEPEMSLDDQHDEAA